MKKAACMLLMLLVCRWLIGQNPALLEQAFRQNSDALMQRFLRSCRDQTRPVEPDWESPEKRFLRPLIQQAAAEAGVLSNSDAKMWKAQPISIPCFWVREYSGFPPHLHPVDYELDLAFLVPAADSTILWIDRSLDSIICTFLDAGHPEMTSGIGPEQGNERLGYLSAYLGIHLDGIGFSDPRVDELYFDMERKPYRSYAWNYASEPMLTAVFTDGRRKAWVVLNQEWRKELLCYRLRGKRWHLVEWQGQKEATDIPDPKTQLPRDRNPR